MNDTTRNIWVLITSCGADDVRVGLELLTPGRKLADAGRQSLVAVVIGSATGNLADRAVACGADHVFLLDNPVFAQYDTDIYSDALSRLMCDHQPNTLLIGATAHGRDLAPRIACRFQTGLTADCTAVALQPDGRTVAWTRPALSGNLMATIVCAERRPQMGTIRPGVFPQRQPDFSRSGRIQPVEISPDTLRSRICVVQALKTNVPEISFDNRDIIVAGGMGLQSKDGFQLVVRLAKLLGGAVGASREAVNRGWAPYAHQIGQSGKTVRPKLYIACGISGAVQHLAGISGADTVLAINQDPNAPIFQMATYGIVGDVAQIIPAILQHWPKKSS